MHSPVVTPLALHANMYMVHTLHTYKTGMVQKNLSTSTLMPAIRLTPNVTGEFK